MKSFLLSQFLILGILSKFLILGILSQVLILEFVSKDPVNKVIIG